MAGKRQLRRQKTIQPHRLEMEALEGRCLLAADLIISEFMASNDSVIEDQDGDASDWIEILNTGTETVDLNGWSLTDDLDELDKWSFQGGQLEPGQSMIVFASNKDRANPTAELHTNFRLSAEGEPLALVSPDEVIVSEFAPYPQQYEDISYGLEQIRNARTLLDPSSPTKIKLATAGDPAVATWTQPDFNDAAWTTASLALGYDHDAADGDFGPLIQTSLANMSGNHSSVLVRSEFNLDAAPSNINRLNLDLNYDDGFVAYLNGVAVASRNAPDSLGWNSTATQENGGVASRVVYDDFFSADSRNGVNLLGNASFAGSRLRLTPGSANQTSAAWIKQPLTFGEDYTFSAQMTLDIHSPGGPLDADGRGGEGMTFVLQTGDEFRLGAGGDKLGLADADMSFVAIEFDTQEDGEWDPDSEFPSHVGIITSTNGSVARTEVLRFNGNPLITGNPGPGVNFRYVWVEYNGANSELELYFSDVNTKPASPTVSAQVDLASIFGGVNEVHVGWTAATSDSYNAHDVVRFEMLTGQGQSGLSTTRINLIEHIDLLQPGTNVLAFQGLNLNASDEDFLLRAQLTMEANELGRTTYFTSPTPGDVNGLGGLTSFVTVDYSHSTKTFVDNFQLELTADAANATIRYTTDGSLPTASSTIYTSPISITQSSRIRARVFEPGKEPGPIRSEGFIKLSSNLTNFNGKPFESNLPVMVFESFGGNVHAEDTQLVPVTGVFLNPGDDGMASILDEPEFGGRAGMRIRGQTSQGFPKKQYALELWDEGNSDTRPLLAGQAGDRSASFFGLPGESDWVLNGPYSDKTQLNNYLTFLWSNRIGLYAPKARLVEVFLNQNGGSLSYSSDYMGTYVLLEKIKIDENRIDIAQLDPSDLQTPDISGGYVWKKDKPGAGDIPFSTDRGQSLRMVEPSDAEIHPLQKNWLNNYINQFEAALYGPDFADPQLGYARYIDVDSWVDTWLLVETTKNIDGFRLSTYYHKDRNGKIEQGPAWDYNLSLANGNYLKGAYPEGWYHDGLDSNAYPYWDRLFEDPAFQQRVVDRWNELRQGPWSTEQLLSDIDEAVNALTNGDARMDSPTVPNSNPIARNFSKWRTLTSYQWPNCFFGTGDCPPSPLPNGRSPRNYGDYIFIMKDFVERRTAWIDTQFPAGPTFDPQSGQVAAGIEVSLSSQVAGAIYYTLDGTDPVSATFVESEQIVFSSGHNVEYLVPTSDGLMNNCAGVLANATSCFMSPQYVASAGDDWAAGQIGVGYDSQGDYSNLIQTQLTDMLGQNTSVYLRIPFEVTQDQLDQIDSATLRMRYDDGFVAYVWRDTGSVRGAYELVRANAPGASRAFPILQVPYNATASADNPDAAAVNFESFAIPGLVDNLQVGTNYLVIQGLDGANSSDFLIDVELAFTTLQSNTDVHVYSGPITIDDNTRINARTVVGNTWSAMASATYVTDIPQLAITELNYNPGAPTPSELNSLRTVQNDDFEFIELKNVGSQPIQLVGTHFSDGVEFEFPNITLQPNEYGVVVANAAAFRLRYGDGIRILGEYAGSLNNGGEKLGLASADGTVLLEFDFEDTALWPQAADGVGASLELIDANTPADQFGKHYRWRSSTENGGSPGDAGQGRVGIVINEILSHTDAPLTESDSIELLNVTNAPIDIGGWFLSDSPSNLFKYQIPDGTVVNTGSYVVFSEEDFNPTPLSPQQNHFALNGAEGDEVWLTQAADGTVEAFVDNVRFGATLNNESLGRIPNGSGYLTPLQQTTLGQANRNPRIGPAVISEVNYNPGTPSPSALVVDPTLTSDDLEYVEIFNSLRQPIDLTRWRIRGGVDFDFADGESLGASQALLVLSFNPDKPENADRLAAFRTHYGLDAAVRLVGGYSGKLSDGSDRIVLQSPDEPPVEDPSLYPRIQQDEVVYDDLAPWANADGNGMSLHRAAVNALGNSASSWLSGDPSPGTAQLDVVEVPGDFNLDGQVNADDINLLCVQLGSATPDMAFDLTGDGRVNEADRDYLVRNVLQTDYGDANLDGVFNSSDLILVFQAGQYEDAIAGNSGWAAGDWNCDGDFNTSDMILAFQAGSYSTAAVSSQANLQQLPDALTAAAVSAMPADKTLRVKTPVASSVVDVPETERADDVIRRLWKQSTVVDQVFGQPERMNSQAGSDSVLTDAAFDEDNLERFF